MAEDEPHASEDEAAADGGACTAEQLLAEERKRVRRPATFSPVSRRSARAALDVPDLLLVSSCLRTSISPDGARAKARLTVAPHALSSARPASPIGLNKRARRCSLSMPARIPLPGHSRLVALHACV